MNDWVDYYEALELEFGCSEEEIKKSYRTLMKKYHPDSKFADEEKSRKVNKAYEVLGDAEKRAEYDSTYFQYKNGEFQEEESQEMPKYTHEEMNDAFTEEEIRFAKKVALQKTIAEALDNAKIIIDAKNELLFAAFNDAYDKDTYKTEYKQFVDITNEYIDNLRELIKEAEEFDLNSEIDTINQVIKFLVETMEEIPESLKDAKRKVKLEIIKEQLQNEANAAIDNAESVRKEFVSLYAKVYRENISKDEFKMYYNILRLGVTDALSQLVEIYDLLKKAELDEIYKNVGILIGKLNKDLELYSGKYKVAQAIGKREDLKEKIKFSMLTFTEYKTKMLNIMQGIIDNPTLDNAMLRVTEGKALTDNFRNGFEKIDKKEYDDSLFSESAKKLYLDAVNICLKRSLLHNKVTDLFKTSKKTSVNQDQIEYLESDVETGIEELEAIKLLHEVYILLGQYEEYKAITDDDFKKIIKDVNSYKDKSKDLQSYLEKMFNYIKSIDEAYDDYNKLVKSSKLDVVDPKEIAYKVDGYRACNVTLRTIANLLAAGIMGYTIFFGDSEPVRELQILSETVSVPQDLINGVLMAVGVNVPLKVVAARFRAKYTAFTDKILIYRQLAYCAEKYQSLANNCDSHLKDIYQRALKVYI